MILIANGTVYQRFLPLVTQVLMFDNDLDEELKSL